MIVGYTDLRDLAPGELELLPEDERAREFDSVFRRRQFRCGRALLRLMLQEYSGRAAPEHVLRVEEGGKPVCEDGSAISITHNEHGVACCVAAEGLVGIDIEQIDERRETSGIAARFFSDEERRWLDNDTERFFMLWVLKEAYVKAHGRSIFGGLEKLRCIVQPPAIEATALEGCFRDLCLYRRDDIFLGLATTRDSLDAIEFRHWDPDSASLSPGTDYQFVASTSAGNQAGA